MFGWVLILCYGIRDLISIFGKVWVASWFPSSSGQFPLFTIHSSDFRRFIRSNKKLEINETAHISVAGDWYVPWAAKAEITCLAHSGWVVKGINPIPQWGFGCFWPLFVVHGVGSLLRSLVSISYASISLSVKLQSNNPKWSRFSVWKLH